MKMTSVTFTRDLRPWRENDRVPVPSELAETLVASGEARDPEPFPPGSEPAKKTVVERVTETLRLPAGRYKTKDRAKGFT